MTIAENFPNSKIYYLLLEIQRCKFDKCVDLAATNMKDLHQLNKDKEHKPFTTFLPYQKKFWVLEGKNLYLDFENNIFKNVLPFTKKIKRLVYNKHMNT